MTRVFDLHSDVLNKMAGLSDQAGPPCVNVHSLELGNVNAACFACFCGRSPDRDVQLENVKKQLRVLDNLGRYMGQCRIYPAFEGLDYADKDVLLQIIHKYHPVYATLTWNHTAGICGSCLNDFALTPQGRNIVRLLEANGVSPDLSHAGQKAFFSVFDYAERPIVTHACVNSLTSHRRNLNDEQIKLIISRNSLFGITFYSDFCGGSINSLVRHILYVLDMGGENCLALGSDFDGCSALPAGLEGPQGYPLLEQELVKAGVAQDIIDKLFFENARAKLGGEK